MKLIEQCWVSLCTLVVLLLFALHLEAFGQPISYQGHLIDQGAPANGLYDLTFSLYTSENGSDGTAGLVTSSAVAITGGLFTVSLNFGSNIFNGTPFFLEVGARTNGAGSFTTLTPRQPLLAAPYATYASSAGVANSVPAAAISGVIALAQLPAELVRNATMDLVLNGATGYGWGLSNVVAAAVPNAGTINDSQFTGIATNLVVTWGITDTNFMTGSYTMVRAGWFVATNTLTGSLCYETNGSVVLSNGITGQTITLSNGVVTASLNGNAATASYVTGTLTNNTSGSAASGWPTHWAISSITNLPSYQPASPVLTNLSAGDGSGLTNLLGTNLTSSLLSLGLLTNSASGVKLAGAFSGSGAGLTNIIATNMIGTVTAPLIVVPGPSDLAGKPGGGPALLTLNFGNDPQVFVGYNEIADGLVSEAGEPGYALGFEGNYNDGSGDPKMEAYIQYTTGGTPAYTRRSFMSQFGRTSQLPTGTALSGGSNGIVFFINTGAGSPGSQQYMLGSQCGIITTNYTYFSTTNNAVNWMSHLSSPNCSLNVSYFSAGQSEPTYHGNIQLGSGQNHNSENGLEFKCTAGSGSAGRGWRLPTVFDGSSGIDLIVENRVNSATWTGIAAFAMADSSLHLSNSLYVARNMYVGTEYSSAVVTTSVTAQQARETAIRAIYTGGADMSMYAERDHGEIGTVTAKPVYVTVGGSPKVYVLTNGNVGIGTSLPTAKLQVAGGVLSSTVTSTAGTASLMQSNSAPINIWTNAASGTTSWTNTTGLSGFVLIGGGYVSAIRLNGTSLGIGASAGLATVPLSPMGYVTLSYTTAPTMLWVYQ